MTDSTPQAQDSLRRARRGAVLAHQAFLRLMIAGLLLFAFLLGATYFYLAPPGTRSVRAVTPVLNRFMDAGAVNDPATAATLFSRDAMRAGAAIEVTTLFGDRRLFDGYRNLRVTRFELAPREQGTPDRGVVEAVVSYATGPPATLSAIMVVEDGRWRYENVRVAR